MRQIVNLVKMLESAGISSREARSEVMTVLAHLMRCSVGEVEAKVYSRGIPPEILGRAEKIIRSRASTRRPLAYILGEWEFWGLRLWITPDVLVPRPETEVLVEVVLAHIEDRAVVGCEIGVGSGAISVSLLTERPRLTMVATDIFPQAVEVARKNARRHRVDSRFLPVVCDLAECLGRCDFLVSNPPYVPREELSELAPEVLAEPRLALDGGPDGLDLIRRIVDFARRIRPRFVAFEFHPPQAEQILALAEPFAVEFYDDLAGLPRVALIKF